MANATTAKGLQQLMRSSKSRSRNKNRNNRPSGGNIINRVFDSSGPDGKVRGTPQQIIEKYNQLHRDAVLSGDRVDAENYAQHAEHYTRMLAEAQREVDAKREEQEEENRRRQAERDRVSPRWCRKKHPRTTRLKRPNDPEALRFRGVSGVLETILLIVSATNGRSPLANVGCLRREFPGRKNSQA